MIFSKVRKKAKENGFPSIKKIRCLNSSRLNNQALLITFGETTDMKRVFLGVLSVLVLWMMGSCNKEKALTNRLNGTWNIDLLEYRTNILDSTSGTSIPLTGSNTNAGTITFNSTKKTGDYRITAVTQAINVTIPGLPNPIIIPSSTVNVAGSGTFTNTENTITITDAQQSPRVFDVTVAYKTSMVLTTKEYKYIDSLKMTVPIDLTLNLGKK